MAGEQLVPAREHVAQRPVLDALREAVGRARPRAEARHHAEHPDRDLCGAQQLGLRLVDLDDLAAAVDEPARAQRRGEARQARSRSRACPSRPRPRSPACRCRPGWRARARLPRADRRTRPRVVPGSAVTRRRAASMCVTPRNAAHLEHRAARLDHRREGVAGAGRAHAAAARDRLPHVRGDLVLARRGCDARRERLVAGPVRPGRTLARGRHAQPPRRPPRASPG